MKGCEIKIGVLDIIICMLVISLCTFIGAVVAIEYKLVKKYKEEVSFLKAQIGSLQERWIWLEERYAKHEAKYHR